MRNSELGGVKLVNFEFLDNLGVDFKTPLTSRPKCKSSLSALRNELNETKSRNQLGVSSIGKGLKVNRDKLETLQDDQLDKVLTDKKLSRHIKAKSNIPSSRLALNKGKPSAQRSIFRDSMNVKDLFIKDLKSDDRNFLKFPGQKLIKYQSYRKIKRRSQLAESLDKTRNLNQRKSKICIRGERLLKIRIK